MASFAFVLLNAIGVIAAQDFAIGAVQQNATPVMQQNGEVIIQYYYPVVEQQFYVPLPQEEVYQSPQIGFPTPQPRFLPSGQLYLDPAPQPTPQSNIYGEVIIGEFEDLTPQVADTEEQPPQQKVVDVDQSNEKETDDNPKMSRQSDAPATADDDVAATENKTPQANGDTEPSDALSKSEIAEDQNQSGSQTKQHANQTANNQTDDDAEPSSVSPQRSDSFMNPLGPIAKDQKKHLFWVTVLTSIAILPVFILLPLILFKYRRGRKTKDNYDPKWDSSSFLEILMWGVPVVLVVFMSARLWHSTHVLDPYAEIFSRNETVNVQVVGLDWKWLFIYPDHGIATVGEFTIPIDQPASMTLTTDTVMQSFMIPALGGQIYAMPGMTTKLNLIADKLGTIEGENTQFNGDGFAQQKFLTHVVSAEDFEAWVEKVKQNSVPLDQDSYKTLALRTTQSKAVADLATDAMPPGVVYFTLDDKDFFCNIMMRYMNHKPLKDEDQPGSPEYGVSDKTTPSAGDNQ